MEVKQLLYKLYESVAIEQLTMSDKDHILIMMIQSTPKDVISSLHFSTSTEV
jgi:hypothetical protein